MAMLRLPIRPRRVQLTTAIYFSGQAEEAVDFYSKMFVNTGRICVDSNAGGDNVAQAPAPGSPRSVEFHIDGHRFVALNEPPPTDAFWPRSTLQIECADQAEVDHYWDKLSKSDGAKLQPGGWVTDRFGVDWQIVPTAVLNMLAFGSQAAAGRVRQMMYSMTKIDIALLERVYRG